MKTTKILLFSSLLVSLGMFISCAKDDFSDNFDTAGDKGAFVSFNVSTAQEQAMKVLRAGATRAADGTYTEEDFDRSLAIQGLTPQDLTAQRLPVTGLPDASIVETTEAGIDSPQEQQEQTRAKVVTSIYQNFTTIGYRGETAERISKTPWFHSLVAKYTGKLYRNVKWVWAQPYAKFYAISPQIIDGKSKMKLSPAENTSTPYVDFEVDENIKNQVDLMTACSGLVHYKTLNEAPETNLKFRHALTAVNFKVGQNLSYNKTITKIVISGAKSKGRYVLPTDADGTNAKWENVNTPKTFTLDGLSVGTGQKVNNIIIGTNRDNYTFYMIPQELDGVSLSFSFSDGTTLTAQLSGSWKAGTTKTYALSEKTSSWEYQLKVDANQYPLAYTATTSYLLSIKSYRQIANGTQQPVPWKIVGYQESSDGIHFEDVPMKAGWVTSFGKESGEGGTSWERSTATIKPSIRYLINEYNDVLQQATAIGTSGNYYNLANQKDGGEQVENTANSYLISAPGYYRIPLVYGNAIKDGKENSSSYQTSNSGEYILTNFIDHAGKAIASPYINKQNSSSPATQASLVWADQPGIVDGLKIEGSGKDAFICFHVPADKIKNGNAVIAVKNAAGTVMWSWHLWFDHNDVLNKILVKNQDGKTFYFTKQTIGFSYRKWEKTTYDENRVARIIVEQTIGNNGEKQRANIDIVQAPGGVKEISSTHYQFGRKDALPGVPTVSEGKFKLDDNIDGPMSIPYGIQHPDFATCYVEKWGYEGQAFSYNLWSINNEIYEYPFEYIPPVVKTVYDPSPVGFHVPNYTAFKGFTTDGTKYDNPEHPEKFNVNMGWTFNTNTGDTIFFPATGYILWYEDSSQLNSVGRHGGYWAATPQYRRSGLALSFESHYINPRDGIRYWVGYAVRPVAE